MSLTDNSKIRRVARLLKTKYLSDAIVSQTFDQPQIARRGRPGQFVQILTDPGIEPFFRRPMSIFGTDPAKGTFSILFTIIGLGTRRLVRIAVGDELSIVGPLGNTFTLPRRSKHVVLVAGGVGLPPLDHWARYLIAGKPRKSAPRVTMLLGARSDAERIRTPRIPSVRRLWSTDDGSYEFKGNVVELLKTVHYRENWPVAETAIYGCGPTPMLKALQTWMRDAGYWGQLSLECMMPCGFGVCSGCVVRAHPDRAGYDRFVRVCYDGPVFGVGEVSL